MLKYFSGMLLSLLKVTCLIDSKEPGQLKISALNKIFTCLIDIKELAQLNISALDKIFIMVV